MTASEVLVQRFVDGELSGEERVQLLVRLGHDAGLRRRAIALEQLALDAGQLPRPVVADGFVASVMEHTAAMTPSMWRRFADALWTPHLLRWNLAGAAAAALLVLLVSGAIVGKTVGARLGLSGRPVRTAQTGSVPAETRVLVRLVIVQPGARTVQAAGDFNGWNPSRTPLEQAANGAWTVTIPLEPGRYEYQFVVDGTDWIADPFASEQNEDGFGSHNAVLDVRAPSDTAL